MEPVNPERVEVIARILKGWTGKSLNPMVDLVWAFAMDRDLLAMFLEEVEATRADLEKHRREAHREDDNGIRNGDEPVHSVREDDQLQSPSGSEHPSSADGTEGTSLP